MHFCPLLRASGACARREYGQTGATAARRCVRQKRSTGEGNQNIAREASRKELKSRHRTAGTLAGAFQIRNIVNGQILLGTAQSLPGILSGNRFQLWTTRLGRRRAGKPEEARSSRRNSRQHPRSQRGRSGSTRQRVCCHHLLPWAQYQPEGHRCPPELWLIPAESCAVPSSPTNPRGRHDSFSWTQQPTEAGTFKSHCLSPSKKSSV